MASDIFQRVSLDDVANFRNGKAISPERYSEVGRYPVFGANGQIARSDDVFNTEAVVAIGRVGANCGSVHYIPEPSWVTDNTIVATAKAGNNIRFLYYLFDHLQLRRTAIGSAQPLMTQSGLKVVQIIIPTLKGQQAIAYILGTLDDKIELNRKMNETLEAMARAIFKSWFIDFDPVHAKAKGRDPKLPKQIADLFPDSFEQSQLGEIPKGWRIRTLADFASLNSESWSNSNRPQTINYVDLSNTKWGHIEAITTYALEKAPSRAQRVLRHGDTIVGTVRPANGSFALIAEDGLTGSTGFAVLRPNTSEAQEFIYLAATTEENIESLAHLSDGGAYPAVRPEVVLSTEVVRPCEQLITQFAHIVHPLLFKLAENDHQSRTLTIIRDTLLPKLLSGEIRVKDAERFVEQKV